MHTRDLLPGVLVAAVLSQALQYLGGYYVAHVVRHAQETSGLFAFVLGLLALLYLGGQLLVLAAEINVVRARRLWPRSFFSRPAAGRRQARARLLGGDGGARRAGVRRGHLRWALSPTARREPIARR